MNTILSLLYLGILGIAVWWFARHTNNNKQRDANFYRLSGHIDYLNKLKNDLEVIDQLITDIQLCKPLEREKAIRIEWTSETGKHGSTASDATNYAVLRGGGFGFKGSNYPVSRRDGYNGVDWSGDLGVGFRVVLYIQ